MLEYTILHRLGKAVSEPVAKFDPDQPRDDSGKWTSGGGSSGATPSTASSQPGSPGQEKLYATGTGTKYDPIITNDVTAAARALHEDKYVKLKSPRQVAVLLDKIREMVDDAKAKGEKAGVYDLCKVSVPGTNLFCAESKGIPRVRMPQIKGVPIPGSKADGLPKDKSGEVNLAEPLMQHLAAAGIAVSKETERADHLRASQSELNGAKVSSMAAALESGKADQIRTNPIFCSRDGYIVDGHHSWAAVIGVDLRKERPEGEHLKMNVLRVDLDIIELLRAANRFAAEWGIPQAGVGQMQKSRCKDGCCCVLSDADIVTIFARG